MQKIIEIKNLSFSYRDKKIFENVSFCVEDKSVNFLVGKNGSGKTTLLKILFFNKEKYFKTNDIQFVWEFQNMYEELSLIENLKIYFNLNCQKKISFKKELQKILEYWDLGLYLSKPVKSLSYGYRQKALITRSILVKPDILIIDEPFLGLDYTSYENFIKIIKDYKDITFLISTQNPNVIKDFTEQINNSFKQNFSININHELVLFSFVY